VPKQRDASLPKPDWTKLPAEFAYLIPAAERYGPLGMPGSGVRRRLKRHEVEELRSVAEQIGWHNHFNPLDSWCIENGIAGNTAEVDLVDGVLTLLAHLDFDVSDYGPKEEPQWTLRMWNTLHYRILSRLVEHTREILPNGEAFELVLRALDRVPPEELAHTAFLLMHPFRTSRALDWIEARIPEVVSRWDWPDLAAVSDISWPRVEAWLGRGRPLSLLALDTLINLDGESESPIVKRADPKLLDPVPFDVAARVLRDYAKKDPVPRVERAVESILKRWSLIVGHS
jgi:hypothetical protein